MRPGRSKPTERRRGSFWRRPPRISHLQYAASGWVGGRVLRASVPVWPESTTGAPARRARPRLGGHGRDGGWRSLRARACPGGEPAGRRQEPGTVGWGDPPQQGGGSASASGTTGSGAHSIVAIRSGRSRWRWRAVRRTLASTCWVSAPLRVRLPPQTLRVTTAGRMACSARQLVASIDGSHKKRNTAGNSLARCLAKRSASASGGGASISRPSRAASRPRADARPCSLMSPALQRSRRARPSCRTACTSPAQGLYG